MLTTDQINDLHRLYWSERWPIRKIERHLRMGWRTIKKYLDAPAQGPAAAAARKQTRSLQSHHRRMAGEGRHRHRRRHRTATCARSATAAATPSCASTVHTDSPEAAVPAAPSCGWSAAPANASKSTGATSACSNYAGDKRKLYAFALVDAHSRMLYLEFTHSQSFETFVRCHMHAFAALGGVAREIAYDNLATAVAEHDGRLVRFLPRFLAFAREYNFYPRACNLAGGWEKGKVERAIGYVRQSFWPLREFTDLHDVNRQARQWLAEVANQRQHRETRQRPDRSLSSPTLCARCRSSLTIIATRSRRWSTKISACTSTAIATVCPIAMWAAGSP